MSAILRVVQRLPFMSMFNGDPLNMDIHIDIEIRKSPFEDAGDLMQISFDLPNSLHSGTVHVKHLEHVKVYFDEE